MLRREGLRRLARVIPAGTRPPEPAPGCRRSRPRPRCRAAPPAAVPAGRPPWSPGQIRSGPVHRDCWGADPARRGVRPDRPGRSGIPGAPQAGHRGRRAGRILAASRRTSVSQLLARMLRELVERETGYARARDRSLARLREGMDLGTGGHHSQRLAFSSFSEPGLIGSTQNTRPAGSRITHQVCTFRTRSAPSRSSRATSASRSSV